MSNTPRRKGDATTRKTARPRPAAQQQQAKRSVDWKRIGLWSLGVAVAAGLIWVIILGQPETVDLPDPDVIPEGIETFEVASAGHVDTPVAYEQDPPVGGPHSPGTWPCGFFDTPIPNESAVHSLEHGVVWITYQDGLPESQMSTLRRLGNESEVIVSPYPGLDSPVVASVWGEQLRLDSADDPDLLAFVSSRRNQTAPENAAGCPRS